MPEEITPPPNESFEQGEGIDYGDFGRWHGWPVVDGSLAAMIVDVEEITINPEDEFTDAHWAVDESYDEPVDGIKLSIELPDVERWNSLSEEEYEELCDPVFTPSDCTTTEEWVLTDPRDVSIGWNSPWHVIAGLKRNHLPDELPVTALQGTRIRADGRIQEDGSVSWALNMNSALGAAVDAASRQELKEESVSR